MNSNNKKDKARFNLSDFSHDYTFDELDCLNKQIISILNSETLDTEDLFKQIDTRDLIVTKYLEDQQIPLENKKFFAESEVKVNNKLLTICKKLLLESEKELIGVVRGRKAIKKYK